MARDFTSKPNKAVAEQRMDFRLDGESFACEIRTDADAVLEWSEMAAAADDTEIESPAGMAFVSRFFRVMMPPDDYRRFRSHLRQHRTDGETLVTIMQAVNEEMDKAVRRETDRPTGRSSPSSPGGGGKDARTSKIISLHEGDFEYADPPGKQVERAQHRQPTRNQRRNQRRRAG